MVMERIRNSGHLNISNKYSLKENFILIKQKLEKAKKFNFEEGSKSSGDFIVSAIVSFGILMSTEINWSTRAISIYGQLDSKSGEDLTLIIQTKLRIETIILALILVPVYIIMGYNHGNFPLLVYLIPAVPVFWFHFVYRFQEKILIEKVETVLEIKAFKK